MTGKEIRTAFLEYFQKQGHTIVSSSPLVPQDDPTLLFTNAGMVQFKEVFLGNEKCPYVRAVSCQKCVRAGGKHNDLENVGHTARHHTFFEMLGNFSFGDYFKEDAIRFGWEFLTECLGLPKEKMWVTVFTDDDEAEKLWRQIGVAAERIVRLGKKDNFWSMGEIGPCGPCSEILYDQGPEFSCGQPDCMVGCDCDRYLELWNLVFMQYNRDDKGELTPLPAPSIDTGMGLERLSAVMQGAASNFESDLFLPIIGAIADLAGIDYKDDHTKDISLHVVADHARAMTFLINDQVMPSNEGRGYVLRRIIRRAIRHGKLLGIEESFLYKMVGVVVDKMQDVYPELAEHREYIASLILDEEERFSHTLEQGLKILNELTEQAQDKGGKIIAGEEIFKLYDTYGFPPDLAREILEEKDLSFTQADFDAAMQQQRELARSSSSFSPAFAGLDTAILDQNKSTEFVGYTQHEIQTQLQTIITGENIQIIQSSKKGDNVRIILSQTPFYAEKGGQVADTGWIVGDNGSFKVEDVKEISSGIVVHQGVVKNGSFKSGEKVKAKIDETYRQAVACNHTATHILQAMLRQVLGDHVKQAGSLVAPDRLRFDFTHFTAVTPRELKRIETLVNEHIRANYILTTQLMGLEEAIASGATALFDEKYDQQVRVVGVGDISKELCGGIHLNASGEIGLFKLVSESSVAAGIRRIEALTGPGAYQYISKEAEQLAQTASILRCVPGEVAARVEKLLENSKQQEKELARFKDKLAVNKVDEFLSNVREVHGVNVLSVEVPGITDIERLRSMGDLLKQRLKSGVIVLGAEINQKVAFLAIVSQDWPLHAGKIVKQVAQITGGGGGGRPDMAQAGGKDVKKLKQALNEVYTIVEEMLTG